MGILGALCIAFSCLSSKTGPLTISFASLPIYVAAFYLGAPEAIIVALLGGAADQIISYGISATTLLWLIPGVLRAVTAFLLAYWYNKLYKKPIETFTKEKKYIASNFKFLAFEVLDTNIFLLAAYTKDGKQILDDAKLSSIASKLHVSTVPVLFKGELSNEQQTTILNFCNNDSVIGN